MNKMHIAAKETNTLRLTSAVLHCSAEIPSSFKSSDSCGHVQENTLMAYSREKIHSASPPDDASTH